MSILLHTAGVDVDATTRDGQTALHLALERAATPAVELLLAAAPAIQVTLSPAGGGWGSYMYLLSAAWCARMH